MPYAIARKNDQSHFAGAVHGAPEYGPASLAYTYGTEAEAQRIADQLTALTGTDHAVVAFTAPAFRF